MKKVLLILHLIAASVLLISCQSTKKYTVTFVDSEGNEIYLEQTVEEGEFATLPSVNPTKKGYSFQWWTHNLETNEKWEFNTYPIVENITLYAVWLEGENVEMWSIDYEKYKTEAAIRKNHILNYVASVKELSNYPKNVYPVAAAYFNLYEQTQDDSYLTTALKLTKHGYEKHKASYLNTGDCFVSFYGIYLYGLYSKYYTDEIMELAIYVHTNDFYTVAPHTPNHALQSAAARYLAGMYFPNYELTDYYGQDNRDLEDKTGELMIRRILKNYPIEGTPEPNSDTYMFCHFGPIQAIAELAEDKELANEAAMVAENIIFTTASTWLDGMFTVAMDRSYQPYLSQNEGGCFNLYSWYLFGGNDINGNPIYPNAEQMKESEAYSLCLALSHDFLPDEVCLMMAWDRTEQFNHKEMHTYYKDRVGWNVRFFFTFDSYVDQFYSIFTSKTFVNTGSLNKTIKGQDQHIFGINWVGQNPNDKSSFTITHWDDLITDNHTKIGATIYSQVFQHDRTVIGVFDIPIDQTEYPNYIVINQPDNYLGIINESLQGRVWLHYGNIMIGYQLSEGFVFSELDYHINIPLTKGYFAVETVRTDEYEGTVEEQLEAFYAQTLINFKNIEYDYSSNTKVTYKSITNDVLSMIYGGDDFASNGSVNGEQAKYGFTYPLQSNPWVYQLYGDTEITYKYKGRFTKFDFDNMEITRGYLTE